MRDQFSFYIRMLVARAFPTPPFCSPSAVGFSLGKYSPEAPEFSCVLGSMCKTGYDFCFFPPIVFPICPLVPPPAGILHTLFFIRCRQVRPQSFSSSSSLVPVLKRLGLPFFFNEIRSSSFFHKLPLPLQPPFLPTALFCSFFPSRASCPPPGEGMCLAFEFVEGSSLQPFL